jgi:hypothetical protein
MGAPPRCSDPGKLNSVSAGLVDIRAAALILCAGGSTDRSGVRARWSSDADIVAGHRLPLENRHQVSRLRLEAPELLRARVMKATRQFTF